MFSALAIELKVIFAGGDKPKNELLKDLDGQEMLAYKSALQDLVKAVSVAVALKKDATDFAP